MTRACPRARRAARLAPGLLLACLAWLPGAQAAPEGGVPDDAYAVVGSASILRADVDADAAAGLPPASALERRIHLAVLRGGLAARGCDPAALSDAALAAGIEEARGELARAGMKLEDVLAKTGQTRAEFEAALRVSLTFRDWLQAQIRDEDLRAAFPARAVLLAGEARASQIVLRAAEGEDRAAAEARARALLDELAALSADALPGAFAAKAGEVSDDPMASLTGGDLDWFGLQSRAEGVAPAVALAALQRGAPGLVEDPVWARGAWHVVLVTQVHVPEGVSFESLLPRLRRDAEARLANETLEGWRGELGVTYAPDAPRVEGSEPTPTPDDHTPR